MLVACRLAGLSALEGTMQGSEREMRRTQYLIAASRPTRPAAGGHVACPFVA